MLNQRIALLRKFKHRLNDSVSDDERNRAFIILVRMLGHATLNRLEPRQIEVLINHEAQHERVRLYIIHSMFTASERDQ